jgi:hypothetical protein
MSLIETNPEQTTFANHSFSLSSSLLPFKKTLLAPQGEYVKNESGIGFFLGITYIVLM